jgi:hypothetical protein
MSTSGMLRSVALERIDVLEERIASILMIMVSSSQLVTVAIYR